MKNEEAISAMRNIMHSLNEYYGLSERGQTAFRMAITALEERKRGSKMPRYIDADALMKEFRDFVRDSNNSDFAPVPNWNDAVSLVGSAPTADVVDKERYDRLLENATIISEALSKYQSADMVEVIRCRDCKWKQGSECTRFADVRPFPDDYCSRGERKEVGDE